MTTSGLFVIKYQYIWQNYILGAQRNCLRGNIVPKIIFPTSGAVDWTWITSFSEFFQKISVTSSKLHSANTPKQLDGNSFWPGVTVLIFDFSNTENKFRTKGKKLFAGLTKLHFTNKGAHFEVVNTLGKQKLVLKDFRFCETHFKCLENNHCFGMFVETSS